MQEFKVRASSAGKIATDPRAKKDLFSQTTITYVHDWLKEQIYGIKNDFSSKYTEKGNILEDEAIDKSIEWLDLPFILKNELLLSSDYFTGTPDLILEDEVIDIKCSWDAFTFPLFDTELPNKDYFYQLQIYMHLTGKKKARVVYLLLNTPEEVAPWEAKYNYDAIPKEKRIKTFEVAYDSEVIEKLQNRVKDIREYIKSLNIK
jgi:hypothetical protein